MFMNLFDCRGNFFAAAISLCLAACAGLAAAPASAEPAVETSTQPETAPFSITAAPSHQFDTSFDRGGKVGVTRYLLDVSAYKPLSETLGMGLHLAYEFADYHFTTPAAFSGVKPWGRVHRIEAGGSVAYDLTPEWSVYLAPSVQSFREDNAGWGNSLEYGGDVTITRDFGRNLTLGLGVEAFSEIRRLWICPLAVVNWKITDRLTLANPSPSGPTGQTGLELVYRLGGSWDIAAGAAYQSGRFRLSKTGPFPNGIAETNAVPAWGRVTCKAGKHLSIDLYGGAVLDGEMRLENSSGNLLAKDKYKAAPFAALAVTGRL